MKIFSLTISYFITSAFILRTAKGSVPFNTKCESYYFLKDSIPTWVRQLYENTDSSDYTFDIREVIFYKTLTDTTSYALYSMSTGNCFRTYVTTQKNKKHLTKFNISEECDEDLSEPEYSRTTYALDSVHKTILLTYDTEKASPKYLVKKGNLTEFKKGYNIENAKTTHYITKETVIIESSGNLKVKNKNSR